jgi:hypothetical protein
MIIYKSIDNYFLNMFNFFAWHNYFQERICIIGSVKKIKIDLPAISQELIKNVVLFSRL